MTYLCFKPNEIGLYDFQWRDFFRTGSLRIPRDADQVTCDRRISSGSHGPIPVTGTRAVTPPVLKRLPSRQPPCRSVPAGLRDEGQPSIPVVPAPDITPNVVAVLFRRQKTAIEFGDSRTTIRAPRNDLAKAGRHYDGQRRSFNIFSTTLSATI